MEQKVHQGRNIKRFREMLGIKQEALAFDLGDDWNQKKVSLLEQREVIDDHLLEKIAEAMKVPVKAFRNFDEEKAMNIIANTFDNGSMLNGINNNPSFHPLDKIIEIHDDKIALYERMLKEKDDMMSRLEDLIKNK